MANSKIQVFGFENCETYELYENILYTNAYPYNVIIGNPAYTAVCTEHVKADIDYDYDSDSVVFVSPVGTDHKELLHSAKKLFIHPSCSLSRNLVSTKYGKSLNPWSADAVVIPQPQSKAIYRRDCTLFYNETANLMLPIFHRYYRVEDVVPDIHLGTKLKEVNKSDIESALEYFHISHSVDDFLEAECIYKDAVLVVPASYKYIVDLITHSLPLDKIVFENSVQESLGDSSNKIDLDTLLSIHDMIKSSDDSVVSTALKALANMDYIHYINSVRYMFNSIGYYNFKSNKAMQSTPVKFMFKQLASNSRRRYNIGYYDSSIAPQDYEVFHKLFARLNSYSEDEAIQYMYGFNFLRYDENNNFGPRLKQSA